MKDLGLLLLLIVTSTIHTSISRIFTRCELAEALIKNNAPKHQLGDWICLAAGGKDGFNTRRLTKMNSVSHNIAYGLFEISSQWFCLDHRHQKNACGMECKKLLDDDIGDDLKCAQFAMKDTKNNFGAFYSYINNNCSSRDLSLFTAGCNLS